MGRSTSATWDLASVEPPWQAGTSIYQHIRDHASADGKGLLEGGEHLPDEEDDGGLKWVAGGRDGAFGHHASSGGGKSRAMMLHRALQVVLDDVTEVKLKKLYEQLRGGVLELVDPLLEAVVKKQDLDAARLEELALWLATRSPDREAVKFAIALLGVMPDSDHGELLSILGLHEEFTLYAAVALSRAGAESRLFELARQVHGWGRIHIVERLADTANPAIKAWMLREGYRNSVMYEYLAYTCATAGELRAELEQGVVDDALLAGAGEIIQALIAGGPAQNIDDYEDGARAVERYLHHLGDEPRELEQLIVTGVIQGFLDDEKADWKAREGRHWTPSLRKKLEARVEAIERLPHWKTSVAAGLSSKDQLAFSRADQAARVVGIDTWEHHFARLESGLDDGWYFAMQTDDPARLDRVLTLAEEVLPLAAIATGPAEEMGLGLEWAAHRNLDWVLQDLRRFPGKGWCLIRAGVRSPVIRNRHMALWALSPWGAERWPPDARGLLETTLREEPDEKVRAELEALLAGKRLENP